MQNKPSLSCMSMLRLHEGCIKPSHSFQIVPTKCDSLSYRIFPVQWTHYCESGFRSKYHIKHLSSSCNPATTITKYSMYMFILLFETATHQTHFKTGFLLYFIMWRAFICSHWKFNKIKACGQPLYTNPIELCQ